MPSLVTLYYYDVTINKKGTKDTLQNIISIPLDVTLKMM